MVNHIWYHKMCCQTNQMKWFQHRISKVEIWTYSENLWKIAIHKSGYEKSNIIITETAAFIEIWWRIFKCCKLSTNCVPRCDWKWGERKWFNLQLKAMGHEIIQFENNENVWKYDFSTTQKNILWPTQHITQHTHKIYIWWKFYLPLNLLLLYYDNNFVRFVHFFQSLFFCHLIHRHFEKNMWQLRKHNPPLCLHALFIQW
jgi:hypothetical protein